MATRSALPARLSGSWGSMHPKHIGLNASPSGSSATARRFGCANWWPAEASTSSGSRVLAAQGRKERRAATTAALALSSECEERMFRASRNDVAVDADTKAVVVLILDVIDRSRLG